MVLRSWLVMTALFLAACGRPSLTEATLRVSVIRTGSSVDSVWVALEDERYPCGKLDATVTLNGVPLRTQTDGTADRGSYLFIPTPGCLPPSYELEPGTDVRIAGQPFELVIEAGGERVVLRSDALVTSGFTGSAEVVAGGALRLVPNGEFTWARVNLPLDVTNPALAHDDADSSTVAAQKRHWGSWPTETRPDAVVAAVPADLPAGQYTWRMTGTSAGVPAQRCEGVVACDVWLSFDELGTVTVR